MASWGVACSGCGWSGRGFFRTCFLLPGGAARCVLVLWAPLPAEGDPHCSTAAPRLLRSHQVLLGCPRRGGAAPHQRSAAAEQPCLKGQLWNFCTSCGQLWLTCSLGWQVKLSSRHTLSLCGRAIPLSHSRCLDLANHYLGFNGWTSDIITVRTTHLSSLTC